MTYNFNLPFSPASTFPIDNLSVGNVTAFLVLFTSFIEEHNNVFLMDVMAGK
jgi:hypothetical protein